MSGREAVKASSEVGWRVARQTGSHVIMLNHSSPALLSSRIADAGMTVDGFLALI
ncbi:type II toxin-antitoxin system HicA family toxin [Methanoculleus bourgensis]|nr:MULTISPECIES: type II toxin-antitoxin system HicA family toxin [Methanoculleus]MBT0732392.1 type II toxin-antitoxin system HicA family toxin [Methanoculleus bourgensis]MDD3373613.1 type II toxin-antitoxin system HicA family toxin [Methanoculleus bourgensis]SAI88736.1 hypothetical protein MBBA_1887 [Methanoculleus bourgensis]